MKWRRGGWRRELRELEQSVEDWDREGKWPTDYVMVLASRSRMRGMVFDRELAESEEGTGEGAAGCVGTTE